jgi:pilus assembly protein CpaF
VHLCGAKLWIDEPTKVVIAQRGVHELTTRDLTANELRELCDKMLKSFSGRVGLSTHFADAMCPDGSRLDVVIPLYDPGALVGESGKPLDSRRALTG